MISKKWIPVACVATALVVAGCASAPPAMKPAMKPGNAFTTMMKSSFSERGIAKLDRLEQDLGQAACSSDKDASEAVAKQITAQALASIKWPSGGQYFGDWVAGETLAQGGRGMTWTDKSADPKENGGNCYNCHRISNEELSYGTLGPSLHNYGKLRGVKSVTDPASAAVVQYTWAQLWNSKSHLACSNMPRFGDRKLLNEEQLRNLMSLLLDPRSPVNQ